jgi:hypothetical protein
LFELASRDSFSEVRRHLVCYLSWRETPWAILEMRSLCNDDNLAVKWAAIGVLARSQPDVALELMGRIPPQVGDTGYRRRVENALAKKKTQAIRSTSSRLVSHR